MSDPADSRLTAFQKDVEALAHDVEELAQDFNEDSRLMGEEMMGAEILATRELIENLGIVWESLETMNDICVRQLNHLATDHATSIRELFAHPGLEQLPGVVAAHCQRRIEHIAEGVSEVSQLVVKSSDNAANVLFSLWKPFFGVINLDWQGKQKANR